MIVSTFVEVKISTQGKYYSSLGYTDTKQGSIFTYVKIEDLPKQSNKLVSCICDTCDVKFERQFQLLNKQKQHLCKPCSYLIRVQNIDYSGVSNQNKSRVGEKHPRWNKNKTEFKKYKSDVHRITSQQDISLLEHSDKPRGRCGVDGAFQLDHIVSVKRGFDENIPAEVIGSIDNLQLLPWKQNRDKWFR
jgi:hypothetical protein